MRKMKKSTNTKQTQKPLTVPKIEDNSTYTLLLAPKHIRYLEIEKISIFGSHACANCKHLVDLKYKNEFYIDDLDFKIEEKAFFNCPKLIFFQKTEKDPKTYGPGRSKLLKQDNYGFIFYGIRIDNFGNVYDFDTYSRFPYDKNKGKL
ncbi:hypothetical protein TRFO_21442 [Tritrichomonas foetus]|uniref:Uncharacterized protein n=1 Tax=Tritrichomonas foetus TaxID=1144522 RepID=A0A1J4KFC3_9EUKA|nr:hypothetical protein TRFO_21442 [Tritrichomonas foetus]|eukprot:OHT09632.1 hypothetical protein TRFO_21442 [Tritrichomonas foetus]